MAHTFPAETTAADAEAVIHFSHVIESFPTSSLAYHLLALALEKAGRAREARRIRVAAARLLQTR